MRERRARRVGRTRKHPQILRTARAQPNSLAIYIFRLTFDAREAGCLAVLPRTNSRTRARLGGERVRAIRCRPSLPVSRARVARRGAFRAVTSRARGRWRTGARGGFRARRPHEGQRPKRPNWRSPRGSGYLPARKNLLTTRSRPVDVSAVTGERHQMKQALRLSLLLILAGCVSTSDVTPMGRDTFMVSTDARGAYFSRSSLVARSAQKANAYCSTLGKEMMPDSIQNQGVPGFTPLDNMFVFRCLAAGDPGNQRPVLRPLPNAASR